jgi:hypothetical protein
MKADAYVNRLSIFLNGLDFREKLALSLTFMILYLWCERPYSYSYNFQQRQLFNHKIWGYYDALWTVYFALKSKIYYIQDVLPTPSGLGPGEYRE